MSSQPTPQDSTRHDAVRPPAGHRFSRRARRITAGLLVVAAASIGVTAWAAKRMQGDFGHGPAAMFEVSPERISRVVDRLLKGVDASDAQRTQVTQIAQAAAVDLKAQREAARALRDKATLAFVAPTVDAAEVETLRQQLLAQHDTASRRVTQALLDISRVLTPEQRVKLAQRLKQHGERMHQRRHGDEAGPQG